MPPEVEQPTPPDPSRRSRSAVAPGPPPLPPAPDLGEHVALDDRAARGHQPVLDDAAEPAEGPAAGGRPPVIAAGGSVPERAARHHHHVLREADQDRWRWRARIRQNPHQLRVYRGCVAVLGLLLVLLGFVTGPLPGPGGIPLVLAGLAIWSSEFAWAARLMTRFKGWLHWFRTLSRGRKAGVVLGVVAVAGLLGYGVLLGIGPPGWLPAPVARLLGHLPGV